MSADVVTIRAALERGAAAHPERIALTYAPTGMRWSYGDLATGARRCAAAFAGYGVGRGDRIALLLPNTPEMVFAYLGAAALGAIATPLNGHLTGAETWQLLTHAEPALVVATKERWARVAAAGDPTHWHTLVTTIGEEPPLATIAPATAAPYPTREPRAEDPAMMLYTSGTTGRAKGALITHANLLANAREIARWLHLDARDRLMCVMPLFHANGLVLTLITPLVIGAEMLLCERFSAGDHWQHVARYRPTAFGSVATMLSILVAREHEVPRNVGAGVRFALCGSAPVPAEVIRRFEACFGIPVIEGYGLTEATCRATFNPIGGGHRPGSAGLPIGNALRVTDAAGHEVPAGEVGEIRLRGANIMPGYFRDPTATAAAIQDGWLRTGDLARRDAQGFVWIVDRITDLIIRAGENVYPREIDEVLYTHPDVSDAVTVGVPDPLYGEEIEVVVVLRPGSAANPDDLLAHCRIQLAQFKSPKRIHIVDAIPKGPTGKLLRRHVRTMLIR